MSKNPMTWKDRTRKKRLFLLFAVVLFVVCGALVMELWNWLMPAIFGLRAITFLQAFGLLALSRILFGGFRSHGGKGPRWARMSPEERERFREALLQRASRVDSRNRQES